LLGYGPCFPQNLTGKHHGGAEFGVAAFKVLIQPELGWSTSYNATSGAFGESASAEWA
jgi:hypothetical protein